MDQQTNQTNQDNKETNQNNTQNTQNAQEIQIKSIDNQDATELIKIICNYIVKELSKTLETKIDIVQFLDQYFYYNGQRSSSKSAALYNAHIIQTFVQNCWRAIVAEQEKFLNQIMPKK